MKIKYKQSIDRFLRFSEFRNKIISKTSTVTGTSYINSKYFRNNEIKLVTIALIQHINFNNFNGRYAYLYFILTNISNWIFVQIPEDKTDDSDVSEGNISIWK